MSKLRARLVWLSRGSGLAGAPAHAAAMRGGVWLDAPQFQ